MTEDGSDCNYINIPGPFARTPKQILATAPNKAPQRKKNLFSSGLATVAKMKVKKILAASNELFVDKFVGQ